MLEHVDLEDDPNVPGHEECLIVSPDTGHRLLLIEVPDEERGRNGSRATTDGTDPKRFIWTNTAA